MLTCDETDFSCQFHFFEHFSYPDALANKKANQKGSLDETNLVESLLTQISEGDIKPRANAFLTEEQKEKARRKSRKFAHQILVDSRERISSPPTANAQ